MSANYPVLPVAGSALLRVFASVLAVVTHWLREFARARRHRRQANVLAGLDRQMLADIGITRTDVRDAFSEPFWDDPTALLRERALERRLSRAVRSKDDVVDSGFKRPRTDRARAPGDVTKQANGRSLSSAARSDTREFPSRGRIQRPPAPPAGAQFLPGKSLPRSERILVIGCTFARPLR